MLENIVARILSHNPLHRLIGRRRSLPAIIRDELLDEYNMMVEQQKVKYNGSNNPYEASFYNHIKVLHDHYWDMTYYHSLMAKYERNKGR